MRDTSPEPVPHPDTHVHAAAPARQSDLNAGACLRAIALSATMPAPVPGAPATALFRSRSARSYGISGNYLARTKHDRERVNGSGAHAVSSSGADRARSSSRRGTARSATGLVDPERPSAKSADAAARLAAQNNRTALTRTLGRAPDDAELYLAHQQGSGGAAKLLANPNARAGDLVGDSAIRSNGGEPNAPASSFTALWRNKFNGIKGSTLPMFASGFGSGQPYYGGAPGPGVLPPLPSATPLPDPASPMPSLMQQAPAAPPALQPLAGVSPPPAPPTMGQVPPATASDRASQALPPPVGYNCRRSVLASAGPRPGDRPCARAGEWRSHPGPGQHRRGEPAVSGAERRHGDGADGAPSPDPRPECRGIRRRRRRDSAGAGHPPSVPAREGTGDHRIVPRQPSRGHPDAGRAVRLTGPASGDATRSLVRPGHLFRCAPVSS